jgi:hypothetical protein
MLSALYRRESGCTKPVMAAPRSTAYRSLLRRFVSFPRVASARGGVVVDVLSSSFDMLVKDARNDRSFFK